MANGETAVYTPPEWAQIKTCAVDFDSRALAAPVHLVQYDRTVPVLEIALYRKGEPYAVPAGADINIRMDKKDGHHIYSPALGLSADRTKAYIAVTPQMTTTAGTLYPIIEVMANGGVASTSPLRLQFDPNPVPEDAITSSDEYKALEQLVADVNASAQAAANSAAAAKTSEDAAAKSAADAGNTAKDIKDSMAQISENKEAVSQLKEDLDKLDMLDLKLVRDTLGVDKIYDGEIIYDCPGGSWKIKSVTVSDDVTGIVSISIDSLLLPEAGHIRIYNADKTKQFYPGITDTGVRVVDLTGYTGLILQLQASESTACDAGTYCAKGIAVYTGDITKQIQGLPDYFIGTDVIKERLSNVEDKTGRAIEPADTTFFDIEPSPNMLDLSSVIYGKYISIKNGELYNNENYVATDFIPVLEGTTLRYQFTYNGIRHDATENDYSVIAYTAMYDENKNFIMDSGVNSWKTLYIPENKDVRYIRATLYKTSLLGFFSDSAIVVSSEATVIPYHPFGINISETINSRYIPDVKENLHCYLPPEICVAVGRTIELYNALVCLEATKYHLDWTCNVGTDYARKWSVTGTTANVGNHTLTLKIYDDDLNIIDTLTSTVKIVNSDISQQKKILPIGDSLTNNKAWLSEVGTLSSGMIGYIGTRGTTIHHEGRSGATANWYNNDSSYTFDSSYSGSPSVSASSNPFWNGTGFSLQHYLTTQSGYVDTPDAVQILLCTNGIALDPSNNVANIKTIVDSIRAEYPDMPIFVCNTIYHSTQDGYYSTDADGYAVGQSDFQYSADMKIMNLQNALAETFTDDENVYIVPLGVCMDREYNFGQKEVSVNPRSSVTIKIPNESVHPQKEGYMQMADVMYSSYIAHLS